MNPAYLAPGWYDRATAAARLGLSLRSLERLRAAGKIGYRQSVPRGRVLIPESEIIRLLEADYHPPVVVSLKRRAR